MKSATLPMRLLLALLCCAWGAAVARSEAFIVQDGRPRAEIVIAEQPPRMVKLAAEELQLHIEKITGAKLPIVTAPGADMPVRIFIGRSPHTDRLNVTDEGLAHGSFRIVSGENWLALVGHDSDFVPREPWARNRADNPRVIQEWDKLTGATWDNPIGSSLHRTYSRSMGIWEQDERGSLNAVHEFLRGLGVRWYMPGELGEVIPKMASVPLPQGDRTVRPDFTLRYMHFSFFGTAQREDILWSLRMGLASDPEVIAIQQAGHGTRDVHGRNEMKQAHPEYYALWGGKRALDVHQKGAPCLSSEGLLQENVRYVRALYDIYGVDVVSVMPNDGYGNICGCPLCKGKDTPDRGYHGALSDYVWDYVNRVAAEVYKTHPNKKISCYAYGAFTLPPLKIKKLSPNIIVGIVHGRSGNFRDVETRAQLEEIRRGWRERSANDFVMWEHYVFTHRGTFWPAYFPHAIASGLKSIKGISRGDFVEVAFDDKRGMGLHAPGFNHLNLYVTSRFWWDAEQDVDALLDEYYTLFYGPAAEEMKAFIAYSEENWRGLSRDIPKIDRVLELLRAAQQKADAESVHGKRIALVADYLRPLGQLRDQLARGREGVPQARVLPRENAAITLDGKLDEEAWQGLPVYSLRELQTGAAPAARTTFRVFWEGDKMKGALTFGIRCDDIDMKGLHVGTRKNGDTKIWEGDVIELLLETQSHSYYQIVVNPAGALVDLDRKDGMNFRWVSGATAAAHVAEDHWSVELRIPVTGGDMADDPNNDVIGRRPTNDFPWHFNLCRLRVRPNGSEASAFSPTGKKGFHEVMKFGKLYMR